MPEREDAQIDGGGDEIEYELPAEIENLLEQLKEDRKLLLRNKAFAQPEQLRAFIGQYLFERLDQIVEHLAGFTAEVFQVTGSNTGQLAKMRKLMVTHLRKLGADIEEAEFETPMVSMEAINDFQEAFYAIGALLEKKLPKDPDMQEAWNRAVSTLDDMIRELVISVPRSEKPVQAVEAGDGAATTPEPADG